MKIRPLGAELFHTDRGTDKMERVRNFANAPKIENPATLIYKITDNLPVCS